MELDLTVGSAISVWSNSKQVWLHDGLIEEVTGESVKVKFDGGVSLKRIPRGQAGTWLRPAGVGGGPPSQPAGLAEVSTMRRTRTEAASPWSIGQTFNLGAELPEEIRNSQLLFVDRSQAAGVRAVVEKLSAGEIRCPDGICCVFTEKYQVFYLLWREDQGENAKRYQHRAPAAPKDAAADRPATAAANITSERRLIAEQSGQLCSIDSNKGGLASVRGSSRQLLERCAAVPLSEALNGALAPDSDLFADTRDLTDQTHLEQKYPQTSEQQREYLASYTCCLSPEEDSPHWGCNAALRTGDQLDRWASYIFNLVTSLRTLEEAEVPIAFRGIRKGIDELGENFSEGQTITFAGFTSISDNISPMKEFVGVTGQRTMLALHLLKGYGGKRIADFSFYPSEGELLLEPNSTFEVKSIVTLGGGLSMVECHQVPTSEPVIP